MRWMVAWTALVWAGCGPGGDGRLTIAPEALAFGTVGIDGSATLEIAIVNGTEVDVALLSATLIEGNPDIFSVERTLDLVPALGEAALAVTFAPTALEPYAGLLQLRTEVATFEVPLTGTGGPSTADADADGWSAADGDCDDGDPTQNPGADELCDGQDTDCDGITPADELDADQDGASVCEGDCDDANGSRTPGKPEVCDGVDNDCDNLVADDLDLDADGYSLCDGDCDDAEPLTSPGEAEVCDGLDNDCDLGVDNLDADLDGHSLCSPGGDCDDDDPDAFPVVVSPTAAPGGDGTDANPYDTLATALANVDATCREVVLLAGVHDGATAEWSGAAVTIRGETGFATGVTLAAPKASRILRIAGGTATLRDLTLTGGDSEVDGGAVLVQGGALVAEGVVFAANHTDTDGGAIAALSSTVTLDGCRFEDNSASDDGGALVLDASTVVDDASVYLRNEAVGRGGAVFVLGGSVSLDGVELRENAATEGGGIAVSGTSALTVERSALALNEALTEGGGIALRGANTGTLQNNQFLDNLAVAGGGGGIAVVGDLGSGPIVNNTFHGNVAATDGAAIAVTTPSSAGVAIRSNVLQSNDGPSALYALGSAVVTHNTGYLTNSGVHFAGAIVDGGGAPLDPSNVTRNPQLVAATDDGNPDNDDLKLGAGSPEIDAGVPLPSFNDADGSPNDRGHTGGPAAD